MKLPDYYDAYDHNKYLDKIVFASKCLAETLPPSTTMVTRVGMENIAMSNRKQIKAIQALLIHVELALEEVLQLREQR